MKLDYTQGFTIFSVFKHNLQTGNNQNSNGL